MSHESCHTHTRVTSLYMEQDEFGNGYAPLSIHELLHQLITILLLFARHHPLLFTRPSDHPLLHNPLFHVKYCVPFVRESRDAHVADGTTKHTDTHAHVVESAETVCGSCGG